MIVLLSLVSMMWGYGVMYVVMAAVIAVYVIAAFRRPRMEG